MWPGPWFPSVLDMNESKLFRPAAIALAVGGLLWVIKFVVIAATDGADSGFPDTATSILYISAVSLMALGLAGLGVAALIGRHPVIRALGVPAGLVTWVVSYIVIETVAQSVAGDAGPGWLSEEIGIVTTGAVLMTVGLLLVRPRLDREAAMAA